jgi:hypothetical protein
VVWEAGLKQGRFIVIVVAGALAARFRFHVPW